MQDSRSLAEMGRWRRVPELAKGQKLSLSAYRYVRLVPIAGVALHRFLSPTCQHLTAVLDSRSSLVLEKSDYAAHDVIACSLVPRSSTVAWHRIFSCLLGCFRIRKTRVVAK